MSTPITMTNVSQYTPYCQTSDVTNLIGDVINNSTFNTASISSFINEACSYINKETNNVSFSPYRLKERYDGNGQSRLQLAHGPVMAINVVNVFFTWPLALSRVAHDFDLLVDREAGTIDFPTYTASPLFTPFAFTFVKSAKNIEVDAWFGYTRQIWGETLSSTDHLTYNLANPTAILQPNQIAYPYQANQAPSFTPTVYKNGVALQNTDYVLVASELVSANNEWQISQDNIYYKLNTTSSGITGITFNTANQSTDVITVDYVYWFCPSDIQQAAAKRAAANILTAIGTSVFQNNSYDGFDLVMIDGIRAQSNNGQWGAIVQRWNDDVAQVIKRYKKLALDYTGGYIPDVSGGFWF